MAPNMALQRARSPSSGRRRYRLPLPALLQHIEEARNQRETNTNNPTTMSPLSSLSDLSDALESTHSTSAKSKGVRFNTKVSIVEIPPPEQPKAARVSFSDEVIDIDTAEPIVPSPSPSPPRKRVRFGCLKTGVRKHLSHTPIYKMKSFEAISPFIKPKKKVRFGCMKGEFPSPSHSNVGVNDLVADEAATFKREKRRGSNSTDETLLSESTDESEEMDVE